MLAPFVALPARTWAAGGAESDRHRRIDGSVVFVDVSGFTLMPLLARMLAEHIASGTPLPQGFSPDRRSAQPAPTT